MRDALQDLVVEALDLRGRFVTLATVLLVSAGLMIRSVQALRHVQPGFTHPEWVETMQISIPEAQARDATAVVRMQQDILEKVSAIPGVESAGLASELPLNSPHFVDTLLLEGRDYPEGTLPPFRHFRLVSPGALDATGTRLVAGHGFTWSDVYARRPIAMISENLAREIWHTPQAALGKRLRPMPQDAWREIVGVVEDVRYDSLDKDFSSTSYWPLLLEQFEGQPVYFWHTMFYVIRCRRTGSAGFLNELERAVWSVNPNLPLADVQSLRHIYDKSMARTSFTLVMLSLAGGMALLLGMVGIYGVISYSVSQRTREIGIRMALGAQRSELTRLFLRDGLRLALIGVACGLAAAAILMRLMAKLLFEVKPVDPATYAAMSACLVAAALTASYLPTVRITLIQPVNALRAE
jgi:predicted permease